MLTNCRVVRTLRVTLLQSGLARTLNTSRWKNCVAGWADVSTLSTVGGRARHGDEFNSPSVAFCSRHTTVCDGVGTHVRMPRGDAMGVDL